MDLSTLFDVCTDEDRDVGFDEQDPCSWGDFFSVEGCVFGDVFGGRTEPGAEYDELAGDW